jgi:Skp family chaperone for outer membrane proteins
MFLARPVILAGLLLFLATTYSLAGGGDDKVAGLNVKRAVFMTDEGRYELEKLSKRLEPKQKELKDMNAEIEGLKQRLNSQASSMSDTDRANLQSEIEVKEKAFNSSSQEATKSLQDQQNEITQRIVSKMAPIVLSVARKGKFIGVVDTSPGVGSDATQPWPQGPLLWWASPDVRQKVSSAKPATDLTDTIVSRYNSAYPQPKATSPGSHLPQ